jgi:hypothetical protein
MPGWIEIQNRVNALRDQGNFFGLHAHDTVRKEYLETLHKVTGRNVIAYYSGWLQKYDLMVPGLSRAFSIHDGDKNGFMAVIKGMDRSLGLDLVLHTPGGEVNATESLVEYLHEKFAHIRVIIPQMAMSAGTMIACAADEIVMGDHSSIGPFDPQLNGKPAHGYIEEFSRARKEMKADPATVPLWLPILQQYDPTLIGECEHAMKQAQSMVSSWLKGRMFKGDARRDSKAAKVVKALSDHSKSKSHGRHFSKKFAQDLALKVSSLEDDPNLQDAVLSVHHICVLTLSTSPAVKIIQNHAEAAFIDQFQGNG